MIWYKISSSHREQLRMFLSYVKLRPWNVVQLKGLDTLTDRLNITSLKTWFLRRSSVDAKRYSF